MLKKIIKKIIIEFKLLFKLIFKCPKDLSYGFGNVFYRSSVSLKNNKYNANKGKKEIN